MKSIEVIYCFKHSCVFFFSVVEDSNLLGFFRGDFSSGWYVAPAALLGLVLVVLLSIVCLCRKRRAEKRLVTF